MHNSAIRYLRKARGTQAMEERHQMFSKVVMKGKLCKAFRFVCEREKREFLQPEKLDADRMFAINETVASVLEGGNPSEKIPPVLC